MENLDKAEKEHKENESEHEYFTIEKDGIKKTFQIDPSMN